MQNKYPWFKAMMEKVIEGKLHMNRPVKTKLACVNDLEALQVRHCEERSDELETF